MQKRSVPINRSNELQKLLLKKAGAFLAQHSYSRGELRDKLRKFAGEDTVEPVLCRLEQLNLLNDAVYAYNFALCRIKQRDWSPAKVRNSLLRRKVEQNIIEEALGRVRAEMGEEPTVGNYLRRYCGKTGFPADLKGWRRLILHLRRQGFDEESILYALRPVVPPAMLGRLETGE